MATVLNTVSGNELQTVRIRVGEWGKLIDVPELLRYRELLLTLTERDLRVRYKQTVLGVIWVVLQPLMASLIFAFIFGVVAGLSTGGKTPYVLFAFAGMLGWNTFSNIVNRGSTSLLSNSQMLSKIYFPRLVLPLSSATAALVDSAFSLGLMLLMLAWYRVWPGWGILLLPAWIAIIVVLALGIALATSSLMVRIATSTISFPWRSSWGCSSAPWRCRRRLSQASFAGFSGSTRLPGRWKASDGRSWVRVPSRYRRWPTPSWWRPRFSGWELRSSSNRSESSPMSSSDLAVSIRGLSKSYVIAHNSLRPTDLREAIVDRLRHLKGNGRNRMETFWALKEIDLDIRQGEVVGIVGRNGAGKSTLLKILSRITWPTSGEIDIHGRVASLLEVGTGFHAELTGRENIFLNGSILGMARREIKQKFDEIVDFSGVEKFLDTPVKRYSSGMYVRLAFAVAAHLDPEILVVDEVLAVGDAHFQRKCLGKMQEITEGQGRTILFVSHNMASINQLCSRGILLRDGEIAFNGPASDAVQGYFKLLSRGGTRGFGRPGSGDATRE